MFGFRPLAISARFPFHVVDLILIFLESETNHQEQQYSRTRNKLLALIPYVISVLFGSLIVALGHEYQWPWQVIIVIRYPIFLIEINRGSSFIGCQVTSIPAMATMYTIDSILGEFPVPATINKYVWGYGVSKFIREELCVKFRLLLLSALF